MSLTLTKPINNKLSDYEAPLLEFLSNALLVVFKNRFSNQPFTTDRVKFLLSPFVSGNKLPIQLNIQLYSNTNTISSDNNNIKPYETCLEIWSIVINPIQKSLRSSTCSTSQTQLKLLYQAIYNRVKRTSLNLIDLDKLNFKISTQNLLQPLPPINHTFDTVVIKRRFKIGICFNYYPEECESDNDDLDSVNVSALTQALRQNMHAVQKEKHKHIPIQTSPYSSFYIPHSNGFGSPIPQAVTLSSSHEDRRLLGSYEESLFRGRMSSLTSHSIEGFQVQLGVLGAPQCRPKYLSCPPHKCYPFPVHYYDHPPEERGSSSPSSPYVGTLTLLEPFSIPDRGQLQFTIQNPQLTCVKVLLIPYDFSQMPANTKTFLRQKSYKYPHSDDHIKSTKGMIDSGAHFQVCKLCPLEALKVYGTLRLIFDPRPLAEGGDTLCKTIDYPPDPLKYTPVNHLELSELGISLSTPGY